MRFQDNASFPAIDLLLRIGFEPDVLLIGHTNAGHLMKQNDLTRQAVEDLEIVKLKNYRAAFPRASLIEFPNCVGSIGCSAERGLCDLKHNSSRKIEDQCVGQHQCSPGPLARIAEQDAQHILEALAKRKHFKKLPKWSSGEPHLD